jgi:hypothetical protein
MKILIALTLPLLAGCSIPIDKQLHIGAGAGIASIAMASGATWKQSCAISVAGGLAKEAYDSTGRGTVDARDAIATGAAGCLTAYVIDRIRK